MSNLMCICEKMAKLVSHGSRLKVGDVRLKGSHRKKEVHRKKFTSLYEPGPGPKWLTFDDRLSP